MGNLTPDTVIDRLRIRGLSESDPDQLTLDELEILAQSCDEYWLGVAFDILMKRYRQLSPSVYVSDVIATVPPEAMVDEKLMSPLPTPHDP